MKVTIDVNNKKIIAGEWKDNVFKKSVQKSKHLFKKLDAWSIQKEITDKLPNYTEIRIKDTEDNIEYIISLLDFVKHGEVFDYGHGEQVFCPRSYFKTFDYSKEWEKRYTPTKKKKQQWLKFKNL